MELENIMKLIDAVSNSSLTSFTLDDGETKLILESKPEDGKTVEYIQQMPAMMPQMMAAPSNITTENVQSGDVNNTANTQSDAVKEAPVISGNVVKSPLVGVFYSASSPEDEPFVKVGDTVTKGQTLGIIEAMKLMNEIECEFDGVVKEILVNNNDVVEYGQSLFVIG